MGHFLLTEKDKKWIKAIRWNIFWIYIGVAAQFLLLILFFNYTDSLLRYVNTPGYQPKIADLIEILHFTRIISVFLPLLVIIYSYAWIKTQRGDQRFLNKLLNTP